MKSFEEQMEGPEKIHESRVTTSPLDGAGVELGISADEIVQLVTKGRRSTQPIIVRAAIGQPIRALSAEVLKDSEVQDDLDEYTRSIQGSCRTIPQKNPPRAGHN